MNTVSIRSAHIVGVKAEPVTVNVAPHHGCQAAAEAADADDDAATSALFVPSPAKYSPAGPSINLRLRPAATSGQKEKENVSADRHRHRHDADQYHLHDESPRSKVEHRGRV
jgi:hypothetical protein